MTIYFYKVDEPYGCFSNFSPHGIHLKGLDWPTVEHYYQAHKFLGTENEFLMAKIRAAKTPEEAAQLGRDRTRKLRPDWEAAKLAIMKEAVWAKFSTHPDIQQVLLDTGDRPLVEDSPKDYFWGCGADRTGHNHLGKLLMSVREKLRHHHHSPH